MLRVLGVYKVENYENVNLIEIESDDTKLNFGEFTQEIKNQPELNWQTAYDEALLNPEGSVIIDTQVQIILRAVFFFHYLNPNELLITPSGTVNLPEITVMPERLKNIVKYNPVD